MVTHSIGLTILGLITIDTNSFFQLIKVVHYNWTISLLLYYINSTLSLATFIIQKISYINNINILIQKVLLIYIIRVIRFQLFICYFFLTYVK